MSVVPLRALGLIPKMAAAPLEPKEAGEGTQVATPSAISNAIYNAVGVRIKELPITPEKILKALEEKKSKMQDDIA